MPALRFTQGKQGRRRYWGILMPLLRAARKDDIPAGTIREFQVNGTTVAIANVEGKLFAINNTCLHRGGPLGEGELAGKVVTCPWHGWQYDVTTGKTLANPTVGVECYPLEIKGDDIFVEVH